MLSTEEEKGQVWSKSLIVLVMALALGLAAAAAGAAEGDPDRGEGLFVGTVAMAGGGAPCLGCHALGGAGLGRAEGASYGPDLTGIYDNFGADGVAAILEDLTTFSSMAPIYAGRPLTAREQADLTAFFAGIAGGGTPDIAGPLAGHVVIALLAFLGMVGLLGWRRLQGVRQPLVERAKTQEGRVA